MKKILFLIHDLSVGGAEKVLVNLVNNLDFNKFDITVLTLFRGGVNEQSLKEHVHLNFVFKRVFPANSKLLLLFSPQWLHDHFIKETYDIEVSYLEGPCHRIISGCTNHTTKKVFWFHSTANSQKSIANSFRSYREAINCYSCYDKAAFVSEGVRDSFFQYCNYSINSCILYNTNETNYILSCAKVAINSDVFNNKAIKLIAVGKLEFAKGIDRLIKIQSRFKKSGYDTLLFLLGEGEKKDTFIELAKTLNVSDSVVFLGYQTNPYKYVSKCDLFVCASLAEGFSTAATEALIVGTPVCTVEVSGMKEMLGENNEYGIVTENNEESLYQGIKSLLDDKKLYDYYKEKAKERGAFFSTEKTVAAVEQMLLGL